mmetsp:Transcript_8365/g.10999  ORF Transcript_8365/g.10999 Transcript_8365/m.10999 type:complete len:134 (-) Transcript_8365:200-601(-)|eukprot:CAMPEP_0176349412 /NCGR_PEP_ID=MMETSP0126-20121128/8633_1 /TAXON_ID=141414 ORGANISM="Strombidinopsis acuminatum, Strain SPMC142" /NCGR_SAMPLE_ID=MMETSP0126 /ASSEMBLY_ACC=CAM_ASM_000229 /LENGTH=133 /DNA_ID=CAMNT_0017698765 /DNA_START=292 /DNA_END=693 /DNA_ORIENTATION=+
MHENAGNIGLRLDYYDSLYRSLNVNIISFAYRGYSGNEGTPSEQGLKIDAETIGAFLKSMDQIDQSKVFLVGRSLGGAVATYLATQNPDQFRGVILENTFTSISDMVDHLMVYISYFKNLILRIGWRSIDRVG